MEYEIKVDFWKYCRRLSALISHVLKKLISEKYNNFTTEKTKCCSATFGFAKLSSEASLRPGGRDSSLQELLLGVEQDVLVTSDDGDPSLHSLVIGSEGVEVTVMEKETSCALWYNRLCRHIAFVFTFLLQSLAWSSPLV